MAVFLTDPDLEERLKAERAESGGDRYDEVWEGVTFMPPLANNEHQSLGFQCGVALHLAIGGIEHGTVYVGVNVSDREENWKFNYRCPDVAVFLPGNPAQDRKTHWFGGPDFGIEILSPDDRSRDKFDFYARVGVRELLLIDRRPWSLELYQLKKKQLQLAGKSDPADSQVLTSKVLPVTFQLVAGKKRPQIVVVHQKTKEEWRV